MLKVGVGEKTGGRVEYSYTFLKRRGDLGRPSGRLSQVPRLTIACSRQGKPETLGLEITP